MEKQKKVGIVVDTYKVRTFKRAITKAGFQYELLDFQPGVKLFKIYTEEHRIQEIERICKLQQINTTRSN